MLPIKRDNQAESEIKHNKKPTKVDFKCTTVRTDKPNDLKKFLFELVVQILRVVIYNYIISYKVILINTKRRKMYNMHKNCCFIFEILYNSNIF